MVALKVHEAGVKLYPHQEAIMEIIRSLPPMTSFAPLWDGLRLPRGGIKEPVATWAARNASPHSDSRLPEVHKKFFVKDKEAADSFSLERFAPGSLGVPHEEEE